MAPVHHLELVEFYVLSRFVLYAGCHHDSTLHINSGSPSLRKFADATPGMRSHRWNLVGLLRVLRRNVYQN